MSHAYLTRAVPALFLAMACAAPAVAQPRAAMPAGGLPIILAQSNDPRLTQLEEQIRQLTGRIEEMNFQILQMQDMMNKMQQDNEFRFQELEGGKAADPAAADPAKEGAATPSTSVAGAGAADPAADTVAGATGPATAAADPAAIDPAAADPAAGDPASAAPGEPGEGAPPRMLGSITFDEKGNATGATLDPGSVTADQETVAALPRADTPEQLYRDSYQFILSGDYTTAEAGFRDYVERFPKDAQIADAQYWLGESLLGQERYRDAAEIFLAASKQYPKAKKAPDMLLKLGVSLAALNQRDVACATFAEIGKRYPGATDALKGRVDQEKALAGC